MASVCPQKPLFVATAAPSANIYPLLACGDRDVKKFLAIMLAALALAGCEKNDQGAFDFAKKEITSAVTGNETILFKDMKLVRVVKLADGTSKGIICGMSTNPSNFSGYKEFAVYYKTEVGAVTGKHNYVAEDKILPGQDDRTVISICR